jgi:hypothetical protein
MASSESIRLNEADAAQYLGGGGISTSTLRYWRLNGNGPVFHKIGRHVRYDKRDLDAFLASSRRTSTSRDSGCLAEGEREPVRGESLKLSTGGLSRGR